MKLAETIKRAINNSLNENTSKPMVHSYKHNDQFFSNKDVMDATRNSNQKSSLYPTKKDAFFDGKNFPEPKTYRANFSHSPESHAAFKKVIESKHYDVGGNVNASEKLHQQQAPKNMSDDDIMKLFHGLDTDRENGGKENGLADHAAYINKLMSDDANLNDRKVIGFHAVPADVGEKIEKSSFGSAHKIIGHPTSYSLFADAAVSAALHGNTDKGAHYLKIHIEPKSVMSTQSIARGDEWTHKENPILFKGHTETDSQGNHIHHMYMKKHDQNTAPESFSNFDDK